MKNPLFWEPKMLCYKLGTFEVARFRKQYSTQALLALLHLLGGHYSMQLLN